MSRKPRATLTAEEVAEQTAAFLAKGGTIDKQPIRQDRAVKASHGGAIWAGDAPRQRTWRNRPRPT